MKQSKSNESFRPKEFFNEQWKLYQKVLEFDYMGHQEIYTIFHNHLISHFPKPFKMLDLGCGDASLTTKALSNTNISNYHGIDLSTPALSIAKQNLASINCQTTFTQGDFYEIISTYSQGNSHKFDVILISFALHHLQLEQKSQLIEQLHSQMATNGILIIIDVVRKQEEDRDTYIKRYLENVKQDWILLTPEEYLMVKNHISESDFPETQQTFRQISEKYGFAQFECLYQDQLETTQLLCMYN
jgi:ubiquinone/menaquinone biosynthesis C-methylase UbiE